MDTEFLPISGEDLRRRGWQACDIILITGDAYVDHPSYGAAIISRVLENAGFKVGIIAQPDWRRADDFLTLGRPRLFFGITAGNLDSMLSNYTSMKKPRRKDEYSPGGVGSRRPNRATIVYANRVRELFPDTPIVLGGIEASLRRLAHYCWWGDEVRRSLLADAKADILVYGMGEKATVEIAARLRQGEDIKDLTGIRGTVIIRNTIDTVQDYISIPSFEDVKADKQKFNEAFRLTYLESDPVRGKTIIQKHANRFAIQYPPSEPLTTEEMDRIYELPYTRAWHPVYNSQGGIPGFETVRFSIISHRGCAGECNFCSLFAHQGRIIQSRSKDSILREARLVASRKDFKGTITDLGGPTANLYGADCHRWKSEGACRDKQCMMPRQCRNLKVGYDESVTIWNEMMKIPKVKHLFIASGLRYDLLIEKSAGSYLEALCRNHVSGQLKVAPEHAVDKVLKIMNKSDLKTYEAFVKKFNETNRSLSKRQYLVNYFITAHPGTKLDDAFQLALYLAKHRIQPEQIQDFIPLPMTVSGCMYYTETHPMTGEKLYVPKSLRDRQMQRALLQYGQRKNKKMIHAALKQLGRLDLEDYFRCRSRPQAPHRTYSPHRES
ncbi:MAG: YgiQ family radical SAM protein [Candidatus Omnitrophica bacterium]|nr:YgiQ family radical SAM protein [Candidatus Omnitrophota bacterium]